MPSRSTRIIILLVIDVVFFFIELISGYAVGSLALVADSFHMLNDVLSLVVALYAIKLTQNNATDQYSYGWHRAEILGALVNGVFLLALCCSIFMEAIERFVKTPEISNPQVIMIVGGCGLVSNIVGLLLFHEHSHGHSHGKEEHTPSHTPPVEPADERQPLLRSQSRPLNIRSGTHNRSESPVSSLYVHPAQTRAQIVQVANDISTSNRARSPSVSRRPRVLSGGDKDLIVQSPRASRSDASLGTEDGALVESSATSTPAPEDTQPSTPDTAVPAQSEHGRHSHEGRSHSHSHGHGHSHGSMNMRALVLHVLGDALGNVGVILTGLVILVAQGNWRYYFDPTISLVIAVIIFSSALPLVRSTSIILLQGVPAHVSLNDIREAIGEVDGVRSVHELHVWQLSEAKVIASVHVHIERASDYMFITNNIRRVLHEHGVHSATIQPEYDTREVEPPLDATTCLVQCPPNNVCDDSHVCCPPPNGVAVQPPQGPSRV